MLVNPDTRSIGIRLLGLVLSNEEWLDLALGNLGTSTGSYKETVSENIEIPSTFPP